MSSPSDPKTPRSTVPSSSRLVTCEERGIQPLTASSWLPPKDFAPLKDHQIQAFLSESHRKSQGSLREAYQTASDPTEWDEAQLAHRRAIEEQEAEQDEDVDELEDEEGTVAKGGKRKRAAPAAKKEAKKPKTAKKVCFGSTMLTPGRRQAKGQGCTQV